MTLVAGWPQFLFLSRAISNDGLALALGAVVLATLVADGRPRRFAWAALPAALAVLAKLSLLFAVGVVLAALAADGWCSAAGSASAAAATRAPPSASL